MAIALAARRPELIDRLVLYGTYATNDAGVRDRPPHRPDVEVDHVHADLAAARRNGPSKP